MKSYKSLSTIHKAKKKFGQNFLVDESYLDKIIDFAGSIEGNIIEIGPGLGFLTEKILNKQIQQLHCIEIDNKLVQLLKSKFAGIENFCLYNSDAMTFDYHKIYAPKTKIIANLPYNISVPLIIQFIRDMDNIKDMTLLVQQEVAERIDARKGKKYGVVSVLIGFLCETEILFNIPPEAFDPKPKVISSLIRIVPKSDYKDRVSKLAILEQICKVAFSCKRKKLRKNLSLVFDSSTVKKFFDENQISDDIRPDQLEIETYVNLISYLNK